MAPYRFFDRDFRSLKILGIQQKDERLEYKIRLFSGSYFRNPGFLRLRASQLYYFNFSVIALVDKRAEQRFIVGSLFGEVSRDPKFFRRGNRTDLDRRAQP